MRFSVQRLGSDTRVGLREEAQGDKTEGVENKATRERCSEEIGPHASALVWFLFQTLKERPPRVQPP